MRWTHRGLKIRLKISQWGSQSIVKAKTQDNLDKDQRRLRERKARVRESLWWGWKNKCVIEGWWELVLEFEVKSAGDQESSLRKELTNRRFHWLKGCRYWLFCLRTERTNQIKKRPKV